DQLADRASAISSRSGGAGIKLRSDVLVGLFRFHEAARLNPCSDDGYLHAGARPSRRSYRGAGLYNAKLERWSRKARLVCRRSTRISWAPERGLSSDIQRRSNVLEAGSFADRGAHENGSVSRRC